jgi:hypothetical protein
MRRMTEKSLIGYGLSLIWLSQTLASTMLNTLEANDRPSEISDKQQAK